ncbi:Phosphoribulokinase/uridine kinase domain-containing protein [Rozella allomycis CSF55]|uniref:uridine/cytidine kinase n=1 Tax=Rozella allomycis (strain CSF55) TaxID=988480 RepID=A0A075AVH5_ROZAC|nr:Phosphoribulokinase/uridine kinase domain-containing protein [Rozella allomycis CSF55]|eukprot:EPZ34120.1 Phosphoribulokinase/uridine kinase domain-containing protein [Rozella allomycis CSF55]
MITRIEPRSTGATVCAVNEKSMARSMGGTGSLDLGFSISSNIETIGNNTKGVNITLNGSSTFKGILLASTSGSFILPNDNYHYVPCDKSNATVTHSDASDKKTPVTFKWLPPANLPKQDVIIRCVIVTERDSWQFLSPIILKVNDGSSTDSSPKSNSTRAVDVDLCSKITGLIDPSRMQVIHLKNFYRSLSAQDIEKAKGFKYNFDHPESFDLEKLANVIRTIKDGGSIDVSIYNILKYSIDQNVKYDGSKIDILIVEGILLFYLKELRDLFDIKIFIDLDSDSRLSGRVRKLSSHDSLEEELSYYLRFAKPAFEEYILPTKRYADIIVPRGVENQTAIDLIVEHLNDQTKRSICKEATSEYVVLRR